MFDWGWLGGAPIRVKGEVYAFMQSNPNAFGGYKRPDGSLIGPPVGRFLPKVDVDEMAQQTLDRFSNFMSNPLTIDGAKQQLVDWGWLKKVIGYDGVELPFTRALENTKMSAVLEEQCNVFFDVKGYVNEQVLLQFSDCDGTEMTTIILLDPLDIEGKVLEQIQIASSSVQRNLNNDNSQSLLYKEFLEHMKIPHFLELDKQMDVFDKSGDPQKLLNSNTYVKTSAGEEFLYIAVRDTPSFLGSSTQPYASGAYKIGCEKTFKILDSFHGITIDGHRVLCQARYAPVVTDKYVFVTHWNTRDYKGALLYRLPVNNFTNVEYVDMTEMLNLHDGRSADWLTGPLASIKLEDEPIDGCGTRVYVGTSNFNYFGGFS